MLDLRPSLMITKQPSENENWELKKSKLDYEKLKHIYELIIVELNKNFRIGVPSGDYDISSLSLCDFEIMGCEVLSTVEVCRKS